jgi:nucleoid-associated protein YgaU
MRLEPLDEGAQLQKPENVSLYVVQPGDTLWDIAGKPEIYGDSTQWERILDANRDKVSDPRDLKIDTELIIPR